MLCGPEEAIGAINSFEGGVEKEDAKERRSKRVFPRILNFFSNVHHWDSLKGLNRGVAIVLGFEDRHSCAVEVLGFFEGFDLINFLTSGIC